MDTITRLQNHILVDGYHLVMDLNQSHGSYIFDKISNQYILDFYTSFASCPIGYNHPKVDREKLLNAAINKIANSDIYTPEYAEFVHAFSETLPVELRDHLFFVEGGSLAVENAIKTAIDWKIQKNLKNNEYCKRGTCIMHFQEAFHGRSGYTLSITNTDPKKIKYFPKFEWPRLPIPKMHFTHGVCDNLEQVIDLEKKIISRIVDLLLTSYHEDIAAIIIEPIQGEGGDNHFRAEFLQALRILADKYDFLLIFDEVQTGFGTTGKYWAFEHFGVIPDILCFGKKTQVCGIAASHRLDEVASVFHVSSRINSTWGGNIVDMVRCTEIIRIYQQENLLENAKNTGKWILEKLIEIEKKSNGKITNARGRGMFIAFDMETSEIRNTMINNLRRQHVLVLASGQKSIRLRPALTMTIAEAEIGIQALQKLIMS